MEIKETTINIDEWDKANQTNNQLKIIAKIDGAQFIEKYTDGNTRTRKFKKGSIIKTIVDPNVKINLWNTKDELSDTTTG